MFLAAFGLGLGTGGACDQPQILMEKIILTMDQSTIGLILVRDIFDEEMDSNYLKTRMQLQNKERNGTQILRRTTQET